MGWKQHIWKKPIWKSALRWHLWCGRANVENREDIHKWKPDHINRHTWNLWGAHWWLRRSQSWAISTLSWSKSQLQFSFTPAQRAGVSQRSDYVPCSGKRRSTAHTPLSQNIFEEKLLPWELLGGLIIPVQKFIMEITLRSKGRLGVFLIEMKLCKLGMASYRAMLTDEAGEAIHKLLCTLIHVHVPKPLQSSPLALGGHESLGARCCEWVVTLKKFTGEVSAKGALTQIWEVQQQGSLYSLLHR